MGWVNDLKWAVKDVFTKKKKKPIKPVTTTRTDDTMNSLKNSGLTQDEIDALMGKKKKRL
jgi:hypothetical protein